MVRDNFGTISDNVAVMLDTESLIAENISNQSPLLPAPELFGLLIGNLYKIQRDSISSDCASQEEPSSGRHQIYQARHQWGGLYSQFRLSRTDCHQLQFVSRYETCLQFFCAGQRVSSHLLDAKTRFCQSKTGYLKSNVDYMCVGTRKHFHDMVCRYGRIIFCVNLMKQKEKTPRQSELSKQYQNAILLINKNDLREQNAIHYSEIDMKFELKQSKDAVADYVKNIFSRRGEPHSLDMI